MKFSDICEKIKSGEFKVDTCGHKVNDPVDYLIGNYQHTLDYANGAGDVKWDKDKKNPDKDWNAEMRNFYQRNLDYDYSAGSCECFSNCESYCFCCGETMRYSFNGHGVSLNIRFANNLRECNTDSEKKLFGNFRGGYEFYTCEYSKANPLSLEINITDKLVFANWFPDFQDDSPSGEKYSNEYSLNSMRGRHNTAKWKAENQNIFYTQVGSCGCTSIWMNKDKNHGYVATGYVGEEGDFPEFLKGYKKVGETDVAVWRVEAADSSKVDLETIKEKWNTEAAIIKVKKGKWLFTSYYDTNHKLSEDIFAEFKLIEM